MKALQFLAQIMLLTGMFQFAYPIENANLAYNIKNASKLFISEIIISRDNSYSTTDFTNIFGQNPTEENPVKPTQVVEEKKNFNFEVLPFGDDFSCILKIGSRGILISGGKKENLNDIVKFLGKNKLEYLEAIVMLDPTDSPENIYELIDMKIATKVILPATTLEKKEENFKILNNLVEIKEKLKSKGASIISAGNNTEINFYNAVIKTYIGKNSANLSMNISYKGKNIFIQNDSDKKALEDFKEKEVDTYIIPKNITPIKELFEKLNIKKAIIANSKETSEFKKENRTIINKKVKDENIIDISKELFARISMKADEKDFNITAEKKVD